MCILTDEPQNGETYKTIYIMYTIKDFYELPTGTINRVEIAKRTILYNFKTINKNDLASLCSAINYGLYEFVIYGQQVNSITYFELKQNIKELLNN